MILGLGALNFLLVKQAFAENPGDIHTWKSGEIGSIDRDRGLLLEGGICW